MIQSSSSLITRLNRRWSRWFAIGALSASGLLLGWVPEFSPQTTALSWSQAAQAQPADVTDAEVRNYARSVLAIEALRQSALAQIEQMLSGDQVPPIRCHERSSINGLPRNAREIAVAYCNQSQDLVESNNLSIQRFNQITDAQDQDSNLARRIREALIDLQRR